MIMIALLQSKRVLKYERCSQYLVSKRSIILFSCNLFLAQMNKLRVISHGGIRVNVFHVDVVNPVSYD